MHHGTARLLMRLSTITYLAMIGLFSLFRSVTALGIISIVWLVIYIVLAFFARCPHCGRFPGRGYIGEHFCPGCGEPLD